MTTLQNRVMENRPSTLDGRTHGAPMTPFAGSERQVRTVGLHKFVLYPDGHRGPIEPETNPLKRDLVVSEMARRNPSLFRWLHNRRATIGKQLEAKNMPAHFADDPRDPRILGYDRSYYDALGVITQEATSVTWAASGSGSIPLSRNRVITAIALSVDPLVTTVTTGTTAEVQDSVDRLLSGFAIVGGPTYMTLAGTPAYLKHWGNLNKVVWPSVVRQEVVTTVSANNKSTWEWYMPFGVFDDLDPFDASSGIPAEDETSLNANLTFAANSLLGTTGANVQVTTATTLYIMDFGVQGMPPAYRARMPIPDFRYDSNTAPTSTTQFNLLTQRYLKRTTLLNLAANGSNNEARNDSNITSLSVIFNKPTLTKLIDTVNWMSLANGMQPTNRLEPTVDKDGTNTTVGRSLAGVLVIDWRKLTHNPWGLNLYPFQLGDVLLSLAMGTTTGSVHLLHEYYALPDTTVAQGWPAYVPLT